MGQPAAKQGDKIVATDIHILMVPAAAGAPVPTPTPMPFSGTLTTGLSTDVFIEGKPAATVDSVAINQPPHIPAAGPFQKPPSNQGKILIGSTGVFINGKPAARQGDMAMTCNDPADMPIGQVMAVSKVFIGETGAGAPRTSPSQTKQTFLNAKWGQQGTIVSADWQKKKARIGDEVKLMVQSKDFEDGTPITFLVWERKGSKETILAQMDGEIQANKAEAKWKRMLEDSEEKLEKEVQEEEPPKYYFVVDVEGDEKASGALDFIYPIDIYLEDEDGTPLDEVKYVVTLSDGTKKKGKFKDGHAKIEDAPYGKFSLEIEGYELAEEESP
jgi:uncharacterized Zn-binding protein involved in type VI secretion